MKVEILADMKSGIVPSTCRTFGELHDYVDANMYADKLIEDLGVGSDRWHELANAVQDVVHEWLRTRHPDAG
jgi:hypothetical protein